MNPTLNPFEKLLVDLVQANIEFITVGGIACAFNGYVRTTEDVDIIIKRDLENVRKLIRFLSSYGEGYGAELKEEDFKDEEGAVRIIEEFPIDVFTVMAGKHFEDLERSKNLFEIEGVKIPYLKREALIELKQDSLREKDKMDVIQLKSLTKK